MSVSVISQARQLAQLGDQIEVKQQELAAMRDEFSALSQQITSAATNGTASNNGTSHTTKSKNTTGRRGRPPGSKNKNKAVANTTVQTGRRGRPPGSTNKTKATKVAKATKGKKAGKVAANERNYDNDMSLKEAVWNVMDRRPAEWRKILGDDLPQGVNGLKISEIKNIIEAEKKWTSASDDISPQVQQAVYSLKNDKKVERGEDRRYYIVKGAKLND